MKLVTIAVVTAATLSASTLAHAGDGQNYRLKSDNGKFLPEYTYLSRGDAKPARRAYKTHAPAVHAKKVRHAPAAAMNKSGHGHSANGVWKPTNVPCDYSSFMNSCSRAHKRAVRALGKYKMVRDPNGPAHSYVQVFEFRDGTRKSLGPNAPRCNGLFKPCTKAGIVGGAIMRGVVTALFGRL